MMVVEGSILELSQEMNDSFCVLCTSRATIQVVESTSKSISPHTCGAVSLLLSGLKAQSVPYSPFSVKRALANTARPLRNHCQYAQGHGLLQVGY